MRLSCRVCGANFVLQSPLNLESIETANVKNVAERILDLRRKLMQTLKALREKIEALERERAGLMNEIETLRKLAETRAAALEAEVGQMREDAKSLRDLLGSNTIDKTRPPQAPAKPATSLEKPVM